MKQTNDIFLKNIKITILLFSFYQSTGFKTGKECLHQRGTVIKLSTGSKELDKLLGG